MEIEKVDIEDKLSEAVRIIHDYCTNGNCRDCLLRRDGECSLYRRSPCNWFALLGSYYDTKRD